MRESVVDGTALQLLASKAGIVCWPARRASSPWEVVLDVHLKGGFCLARGWAKPFRACVRYRTYK
ncbi:MAG: hypothetical protein EXR79_11580 [Myxococcales bacterium]|nr:hypothetical protein [Myxococcales bacterium]